MSDNFTSSKEAKSVSRIICCRPCATANDESYREYLDYHDRVSPHLEPSLEMIGFAGNARKAMSCSDCGALIPAGEICCAMSYWSPSYSQLGPGNWEEAFIS